MIILVKSGFQASVNRIAVSFLQSYLVDCIILTEPSPTTIGDHPYLLRVMEESFLKNEFYQASPAETKPELVIHLQSKVLKPVIDDHNTVIQGNSYFYLSEINTLTHPKTLEEYRLLRDYLKNQMYILAKQLKL